MQIAHTVRVRLRRSVDGSEITNRARFARLSELNDPFEGRPFVVPQHGAPVVQAAAVYASVLSDAKNEGLSGKEAERQARIETAAVLSPLVTQHVQQDLLRQALDESFWTYGVSATRDPILMWSHYADGHKGIVLHFDACVLPFDRLFEVHYSDRYPEYPFPGSAGGRCRGGITGDPLCQGEWLVL
jgi:hypothetical protein